MGAGSVGGDAVAERARRTAGFCVREVTFGPGHALPRHDHEHAVLVLMYGGRYRGRGCGSDYALEGGDWLLAPAATDHEGRVGPRGSKAILIEPLDPRHDLFADHLLSGVRHFGGREPRRMALRLARELDAEDPAAGLALEGAVLDVVTAFHRAIPRERGRPPGWVGHARDMIEADDPRVSSLSDLATELGVAASRLHREFKAAFGCSVAEYARARRLERAAELLTDTHLPLSQVALEVGFYDQSHLTNAFREHFGVTPGRYRVETGS